MLKNSLKLNLLALLLCANAAFAVRYAIQSKSALSKAELAALANIDELDRLLVNRDINGGDRFLDTPLYHAVLIRRVDLVQALLARGADPRLANLRGFTPIHIAAYQDDPEIILVLVQHAPALIHEVTERNIALQNLLPEASQPQTPFQLAYANGRNKAIRQILFLLFTQAMPEHNSQLLIPHLHEDLFNMIIAPRDFRDLLQDFRRAPSDGAESHNQEHGWVREFIILNKNRNFKGNSSVVDDSARHASLIGIRDILISGTHPENLQTALDRQDRFNRTPLHNFLQVQRLRGIYLMLRLGARIDIPDLEGYSAFAFAMRQRWQKIRQIMLFEFLYRVIYGHYTGERDSAILDTEINSVLHLVHIYLNMPDLTFPTPALMPTGTAITISFSSSH